MKNNWVKQYTRPHSLQTDLPARFLWFLVNPYYRIKNIMYVPVTDRKADCYFKENEWKILMTRLAKEFYRDRSFIKKNFTRFRGQRRRYLQIAKKLRSYALRQLSNDQLLTAYQEYVNSYAWYAYFFFFPWSLDQVIDPLFYKELQRKTLTNADKIYLAVTSPTKKNVIDLQRDGLLRAKAEGRLKSILKKHVLKYGWLGIYDVNDKPLTGKDFLHDVNSVKRPWAFLKDDDKKMRQRRKEYNQALVLLKHHPQLYRTAVLIHEYVWLRTERVDIFRQCLWLIQPFFRLIEKRLSLPWGHAAHLTIDEMIDYLRVGKVPNKALLSLQHRHGQLTYYKNGKLTIIRQQKIIIEIVTRELGTLDFKHLITVKGVTASPGRATGKVKVLFKPSQATKMKKGDILIANMTHPDYMSAMKKAAAIVTDEGGITCHAAIISRELNIPCVIGTKIATKVFRDGDRVEVDASNGVVKKYNYDNPGKNKLDRNCPARPESRRTLG